jgi:hypothetical protein
MTAAGGPDRAGSPYSGVALAKKLGIKAETVVALIGAPPDFESLLGALPPEVQLRRDLRRAPYLTIWFVKRLADLEREWSRVLGHLGAGGLWICWPKKSSGLASDLSQDAVQEAGLDAGLVDHKICSVDPTWTGLKFARRREGTSARDRVKS